MRGCKVYDWLTTDLRRKTVWTDISFKVAREATIKVARLISGHGVRMIKKMQNKSDCV